MLHKNEHFLSDFNDYIPFQLNSSSTLSSSNLIDHFKSSSSSSSLNLFGDFLNRKASGDYNNSQLENSPKRKDQSWLLVLISEA